MRGAVLVAIAAAIGNLLQGWDNATIAGAVLYIKHDFHLESQPAVEGLLVATSLIGATLITTFSGPVAAPTPSAAALCSSLLYFLAGLLMLWSPGVHVLLLARLVDGFAIGLAVTLVPVYISETAPPEIRGLLNTLPQFTGSGGMFLAYCMVFSMTLAPHPDWRLMLGVLSLLSLLYLLHAHRLLPPGVAALARHKGRMKEARAVLRMLRGRDDVAGEMALLVEGLGTVGDTAIEEYIVGPPGPAADATVLYGPERGMHVVGGAAAAARRAGKHAGQRHRPGQHARPPQGPRRCAPRQHALLQPRQHAQLPSWRPWTGTRRSPAGCQSDGDASGTGDLHAPLLELDARGLSSMTGEGDTATTMGIGGGWQRAWKCTDGPEGGVKRMYLHEEAGGVHAAALYLHAAKQHGDGDVHGPAFVHGARWRELLEPGVRRHHAGAAAVLGHQRRALLHAPQILDQAGVSVLLASLGLSADSTSILISRAVSKGGQPVRRPEARGL
ncbi:LOW QUALITY PROTEIN: hypothetical protein BDA96_04G384000 [Sorghum bicolor]|uniref:Major facilitator superfamily (MFS) profile domain-containing protein n=1 Tax=Sorghum bicolor TaxID=4558 RepID=A0A921R8J1_SORBI|nr:LOW QUALITY PROTEIN: hypothetical protein BDA96_04G384000 [Sorghum bicolor]